MWQNFKKNPSCDTTKIVTKIKLWQNSHCDKNQNVTKLELWPKTQIVTTLQKIKLWQNSKLKLWQNINYDKSQFMTKYTLEWAFIKNILTPWQPMRCSLSSFLQFLQCFHIWPFKLSKSTIQILFNFFHHKRDPFDLGGVRISQFRFASSLRWNKTTSDILG